MVEMPAHKNNQCNQWWNELAHREQQFFFLENPNYEENDVGSFLEWTEIRQRRVLYSLSGLETLCAKVF